MMIPVVSVFVVALAVSLDGFGVGVMYGLRKIRIPLLSIAIISFCSGIVIFISMYMGSLLLNFLSHSIADIIGACILIVIGLWAIYQISTQKSQELRIPAEPRDPDRPILHIELKRLGFVIEILRTPSKADIDRSGNISASEAALLGAALSLDAFGAGIGAALIGLSPILTALVIAFASGLFLTLGLKTGHLFSGAKLLRRFSLLPGIILIIMGIVKLF